MRRTQCYSVLVACLIPVAVATCACASHGWSAATEMAGTPSATGCDAWFEIGGTFARQNDIRFTLRNRSANVRCSATRVEVLFASRLRTEAFRVSAPTNWTSRDLPCPDGKGSCGFEWRANGIGVPSGQELAGFGLTYVPADAPRLRSWVVDVGRRRVEMPIGTVGG